MSEVCHYLYFAVAVILQVIGVRIGWVAARDRNGAERAQIEGERKELQAYHDFDQALIDAHVRDLHGENQRPHGKHGFDGSGNLVLELHGKYHRRAWENANGEVEENDPAILKTPSDIRAFLQSELDGSGAVYAEVRLWGGGDKLPFFVTNGVGDISKVPDEFRRLMLEQEYEVVSTNGAGWKTYRHENGKINQYALTNHLAPKPSADETYIVVRDFRRFGDWVLKQIKQGDFADSQAAKLPPEKLAEFGESAYMLGIHAARADYSNSWVFNDGSALVPLNIWTRYAMAIDPRRAMPRPPEVAESEAVQ